MLVPATYTQDTLPDPPGLVTVGQRWRFRRNLAIATLYRQGFSLRLIADVFDLPHSRIAAILKEFREKYDRPVSPP